MNKAQATAALEMGHAIRHNTSLPNGYYYTRQVEKNISVPSDENEEGSRRKKKPNEAKSYFQTEVFDEFNQCMGTPETFFRMKGLQMHETGWSISTTAKLNPITKQPKNKNGKAKQ